MMRDTYIWRWNLNSVIPRPQQPLHYLGSSIPPLRLDPLPYHGLVVQVRPAKVFRPSAESITCPQRRD